MSNINKSPANEQKIQIRNGQRTKTDNSQNKKYKWPKKYMKKKCSTSKPPGKYKPKPHYHPTSIRIAKTQRVTKAARCRESGTLIYCW